MNPIHLSLRGFLSYHDPVELDFNSIHLACISGSNGAGKSSLLDAITWVLFGQARKRDESIINLQSKTAEVAFIFDYEENLYRVVRTLTRGKTTVLEFQIAQEGGQRLLPNVRELTWRPLTEHSLRETQARIEQTLRLDFETFINVSFFLQGRADQFTQQPPSRRKEILGSILGLELWEAYKVRASDQRKVHERELVGIDGRLQEIDAELAEEPLRKTHLAELEGELTRLTALRKSHEYVLSVARQAQAALEKQKELVQTLGMTLKQREEFSTSLKGRLAVKQGEYAEQTLMLDRASEIEASYAAWISIRKEVEHWDGIAAKYREQEKRRQPFLDEINAVRAKLQQEHEFLVERSRSIEADRLASEKLGGEIDSAHSLLRDVDAELREKEELQKRLVETREKLAELRAENSSLKAEMDELDGRIKKLESSHGADCPLCGQPLSSEHRKTTLDQIRSEGNTKAEFWRSNKRLMDDLASQLTAFDSQISTLGTQEVKRTQLLSLISQLSERLGNYTKLADEWTQQGQRRLAEVTDLLEKENYAELARRKMSEVDREILELGYNTTTHEKLRETESQSRDAEVNYRNLEAARAAIKPLQDEITNLGSQVDSMQTEIDTLKKDFDGALSEQASAEAQFPDLKSAEKAMFAAQEEENRLLQEVGGARQKVSVLVDLQERRKTFQVEREELSMRIEQYKSLERAFGKDGVPALLIEQALPEIETKANELLDRLSDGVMSVRIITQSAYKTKGRDDLKESLDIQISDGAGTRDYEMYSGGEAFRVNFAIRLALSEMLASRKGARLQMLVIDEGFGSQDLQGRQRLIQTIRAVQDDFSKILVITHLDELKDAFPTRIEVEKSLNGSTISVST